MQAVVAIKQIEASLHDMFASTRESIEFAGLDNLQRYNLDQSKADSLYAQALASNDPAEVQRLSQRIDGYINDAFAQLSADQQITQRAEFLSHVDQVDATLAGRLEDIGKNIGGDANSAFADVRDILNVSGEKHLEAASTQVEAANVNADTADANRASANAMITAAQGMLDAAERIANTVLTLNIQGGNFSPVGQ